MSPRWPRIRMPNGELWCPACAVNHGRTLTAGARIDESSVHLARADWDEYRWAQDAQRRRYEQTGVGGGKEEHDHYFGLGEHGGAGTEHLLTPKDWMRWSRTPRFDDLPPSEQEWHRGYELGERHGADPDHADFTEMDTAAGRSSHPDHFSDGYTQGLHRALPRTAKAWTPEDAVRFEVGRQKVKMVTERAGGKARPLCEHHQGAAAARAGLTGEIAYGIGLRDEGVPSPFTVHPGVHEGRCADCAREQSGQMPWVTRRRPGYPEEQQEATPMPESEFHRGGWPYRERMSYERTAPVDTSIQSLNSLGENAPMERIAVRQSQGDLAPNHHPNQRLAHLVAWDQPDIVKCAHDSGDSQTVFHCLAGNTRYITRDGVRTLAETVGTKQFVLTADPADSHGGRWVEAPIVDFGRQRIWELTLRRNRRTKVIRTTSGHRWFVRRPDHVLTTEELRPGHRLAHLRAPRMNVAPDHDGIRMGFVFGDGSIQRRNSRTYGAVTLWGEKVVLAKYFDEVADRAYQVTTDNGVPGLRYTSGMIGYDKVLPDLYSSPEHLYGWLMGLFAADGSITKAGQATLSSASLETLLHVRDIATVLGIGTYEPTTVLRKGFGPEPTELHTLGFAAEDLSLDFFLRGSHQERANPETFSRFGWTVVSVQETDDVEQVYCAVVPGFESFVLEDNIHTGNCPFCGSGQVIARSDGTVECEFCHSAFTVQVQPEFSAFPQTIDGVPVDVPGMPSNNQGMPPGADPAAAGVPPADGGFPPGEGDDTEDDESGEDDKPAFLKGSVLRTESGADLPVDEYLRHIALAHAPDRDRVLRRVRHERGAS